MDTPSDLNIIRPFLISEKRTASEVRRHARKLAEKLTEEIKPEIAHGEKVLFVFPMRGSMLLYPAFAEVFRSASFIFIDGEYHTELDCTAYDTVVTVDTVVETGKTVINANAILANAGFTAKRRIAASVLANTGVKGIMSGTFDKFISLVFTEDVRVTVDFGEYAACGNAGQTGSGK